MLQAAAAASSAASSASAAASAASSGSPSSQSRICLDTSSKYTSLTRDVCSCQMSKLVKGVGRNYDTKVHGVQRAGDGATDKLKRHSVEK